MQELIEYAHDLDFGGWEDVFIQKATELLEKEKEQMKESSISGSKGNSFEQYYNQTYNQNK